MPVRGRALAFAGVRRAEDNKSALCGHQHQSHYFSSTTPHPVFLPHDSYSCSTIVHMPSGFLNGRGKLQIKTVALLHVKHAVPRFLALFCDVVPRSAVDFCQDVKLAAEFASFHLGLRI